jgi:hypothetical protein
MHHHNERDAGTWCQEANVTDPTLVMIPAVVARSIESAHRLLIHLATRGISYTACGEIPATLPDWIDRGRPPVRPCRNRQLGVWGESPWSAFGFFDTALARPPAFCYHYIQVL